MNDVVAAFVTVCGVLGLMVPLVPAEGVTVQVLRVKVAVTVQLAVMGFVV